jgi:3'-phosphoadenosine 5'-phosphosulfate (PAPS) 3'-phosphatase
MELADTDIAVDIGVEESLIVVSIVLCYVRVLWDIYYRIRDTACTYKIISLEEERKKQKQARQKQETNNPVLNSSHTNTKYKATTKPICKNC